jgi:hypothetical protein
MVRGAYPTGAWCGAGAWPGFSPTMGVPYGCPRGSGSPFSWAWYALHNYGYGVQPGDIPGSVSGYTLPSAAKMHSIQSSSYHHDR